MCRIMVFPIFWCWLLLCSTYTFYSFAEEAHSEALSDRPLNKNLMTTTALDLSTEKKSESKNVASTTATCRSVNNDNGKNAPPAIEDLAIYSKKRKCVYMRWMKPFKQVEQYYIEYSYNNSIYYINQSKFDISNCTKWKDMLNYICTGVCNLTQNTTYTFKVRAKYKDVDTLEIFSEPKSAITREEEPEPPRNLTFSWSGFNLTLLWEYPLFPNGNITAYNIYINGMYIETYKTTPKKQYTYSIAGEFKDLILNISVETVNGAGRSNSSIKINTPTITTTTPTKTITIPTITTISRKIMTNTSTINTTKTTITITPTITITTRRIATATPKKVPKFRCQKCLTVINNSTISIKVSDITNLEGDSYIYVFDINDKHSTQQNSRLHCNDILNYTCHEAHKPIILLINQFENNTTCSSSIVNCKPGNMLRGSNNTKPDDVPDNSEFTTSLAVLISFLLVGCIIGAIRFYYVKMKSKIRIESPKEEIVTAHFPVTAAPPFSQIVGREDFKNYITQEKQLQKQFQTMNELSIKLQTVGEAEGNKSKNRYQNIIPFDDMRVILNKINGDVHSDYINATYIHGYNAKRRYIAAQGPLTTTLSDFWRMIWQENVECIVMLANLTEDGKVTHIHFTEWPDHGVPDSPLELAELITEVRNCNTVGTPILVHCSAGIGRTGTFILCDIALDMVKDTGKIDVYKIFHELRQQRCFMVQMPDQYLYAHDVILELLEKDK